MDTTKQIPGLLSTSIGRKIVMGITGLFLCTFLVAHLSGNLLLLKPLFDPQDGGKAFNEYAEFMSKSPMVRIPEIIMFLGFIVHIGLAAKLTSQNKKARPQGYIFQGNDGKTSIFSKYMGVTGSIVLIFLLVHLYSFFVKHRIIGTEETMYETVKTAFSNPIYVLFYVVAQILLAFHLNHGFQSGFQSLGLKKNPRWNQVINKVGLGFSILIPLGFAIIPIVMYIQSIS
ncbi:MAG: succinate dehydrogenase [Bacteroidia bacterium]|jgi:succinate dehydrogenase / fumarate reductase cytochrome b subunit|nr:MAG: succinate dehydrogenase [Bacteroidia bacterium]